MRSLKNNLIKLLCLLIVFVMLFAACKPQPAGPNSSDPSSSDNSSSDIVSSDDTSSDNTSSDDKPDVENTNKPSEEEEDKVNGKFTKSDANAFTHKKSLKGKNNKITNFKLLTEKPVAFNLVEFEFNVPNLPADLNVYIEDQLDITMELTGSNGKKLEIDAFYYEEYKFTDDLQQIGRSDAPSSFRFRVSPQGAGTWDFAVTLKIKGEKVDTLTGYINVQKDEDGSQILEVEPNRKQTFITRAGDNYVAIGENLAWNDPVQQKSRWAQYISQQMRVTAQYGANYTRVWDYWESGGSNKTRQINVMNQSGSAQWDLLFETAEELDYYICFNMFSHGEITQYGHDGSFPRTWFYSGNGGYLDTSDDFYVDERTKAAVKTYIRYVISRYGYSEHIFSWEIVNEISHAYKAARINETRAWLKEMATYIRDLDQYDHMVATSTGPPTDPLSTYKIFDYVFYHYYNYDNIDQILGLTKSTWLEQKRPVLYGEWGVDGAIRDLVGGNITDDLVILHHGNWLNVMGGAGGTGFSWWWEDVDAAEAQWTYQVVSEIAKEIPWSDPNMIMTNTTSVKPSNDQIGSTGYRGKDYAYLWFYDKRFNVKNKVETTFENETAQVQIEDGTYHVRWVNTWTGVSVKKEVLTAKDGLLEFEIPKWSKDIVVAITVD